MGLGSAVISSLGKEKAVYEDDREREREKKKGGINTLHSPHSRIQG